MLDIIPYEQYGAYTLYCGHPLKNVNKAYLDYFEELVQNTINAFCAKYPTFIVVDYTNYSRNGKISYEEKTHKLQDYFDIKKNRHHSFKLASFLPYHLGAKDTSRFTFYRAENSYKHLGKALKNIKRSNRELRTLEIFHPAIMQEFLLIVTHYYHYHDLYVTYRPDDIFHMPSYWDKKTIKQIYGLWSLI